MGYDMHWQSKADGEDEAVAAAENAFHDAAAERDALPRAEAGTFNRARFDENGDMDAHENYDGRTDRFKAAQDKVHAAYEALDDARQSYFRLNISGMGAVRQAMGEIGMVFDDDPHPPFPEAEDYGTAYEYVWAVEDPEDDPDTFRDMTAEDFSKAQAYIAEKDRVLAWHGRTDTPGIPIHKFGSNDGWLVLPAECEAAVRIYRDWLREGGERRLAKVLAGAGLGDYPELWQQWIDYLIGAAKHGGFEVY